MLIRYYRKGFLILSLVFCLSKANAQVDPHFSQYYMYPLWLNPALTGAIDGDYRIAAIHRSQWGAITNSFSTFALSADMVTKKNINLGVNLLQQKAGDAGYRYTNGQFSVCYTGARFGREGNKSISFALQGGMLGRSFDNSKITTNSQFNSSTGSYDPSLPTAEPVNLKNQTALDLGAGALFYDADPEKNVNVFAGIAAAHLNNPKDPSLGVGSEGKLPTRYTVHGGANIIVSDHAKLVPNALYMSQGTAHETMLGGYVQFGLNPTTDFMLGANYRVDDAVYPYLGISFPTVTAGLSYDVNTSQLGKVVNGTGSFEFSLMYSASKNERANFKCPRF